jgi:hypothetical protein
MKVCWHAVLRRLAAVFAVGAATAWSSAVSYAQIALDNALNSAYADGWQAGDDGGFGFGPWNFDGSYDAPPNSIHLIDDAHPENDIGKAWALSLNFENGLARAGRRLDAPLSVGQTLSMVVDIPTEHRFFKGYTLRLNTGGSNICYGGTGCTTGTSPKERFAVWSFHDQSDPNEWGRWRVTPSPNPSFIPFYDEDSDAGLRIEFKLTGPESYELKMTSLEPGGAGYMRTGDLFNPGTGAIDWIEFLHYDEFSDPTLATDIYISSLQVTGAVAETGDFDADGDVDGADFLRWQRGLGTATGATRGQGDSNGDGDVDAGDLGVWKNQFASATVVASGVPEPLGLSLIGAGLAGMWRLCGGADRAARRNEVG